jgi:hypothetical protein
MVNWLAAVSSRDQGRILAWSLVGAAIGVFLFFRGFRMLQLKRLIENTPTSNVRSASMGLVELSGMPVGPNTIPAGITGDPCFYYRATAWERRQSGNSSEWKQVAQESLFVPFFLKDETGLMLINAQGADMDVHRTFKDEFGSSFFSSGNMAMGSVEDFLLRYGLEGKHVQLEEYCIQPEYPIFVLGTLCENSSRRDTTPERHIFAPSSSLSLRTGGFLQMFSGKMSVQTRVSTTVAVPAMRGMNVSSATRAPAPKPTSVANGAWSDVSMDEVHRPVAATPTPAAATVSSEQPLPSRYGSQTITPQPQIMRPVAVSLPDTAPLDLSANAGFNLNAPAAVSKGESDAPFTISCESQRELIRALGWKSAACIWGGPGLTVACVYLLLFTLGWL